MPLIHLPSSVAERPWLVVLVAADLVGGLAAELDDVERVEHDLGVRDALGRADRFLIAGGHVDRDRPDRRLLLVA